MTLLSGYLQKARLERAQPFVRGDVLDLGCGLGVVRELCHDRIASYVGVERQAEVLADLRARHPDAHFYERDLDMDALDMDRRFDVVLMVALVEHLFNQKHVFDQVVRCLKPDGRIVITTPTVFGNDIVHRLGAALGLFAKSAADDHIVIYNKKRFQILAKEIGLSLERYCTFEFGCNQLAVLRRT